MAQRPPLDPSTRIKATSVLYKKAVKPLIEKKRRTRINACLNELKGLLQEGKAQKGRRMEKIDILEQTVKEFKKLKRSRPGASATVQELSVGCYRCQNVSHFPNTVNPDPRPQSQLVEQFKPELIHLAPQEVESMGIPATASCSQEKVPQLCDYMGYNSTPTDQRRPSPQLWAPSPSTFQMVLPSERFPTIMHGPFEGYSFGAHHLTPGLGISPSLPVSTDFYRPYSFYHAGETGRQYFPFHHMQPASIAWGIGYPLQQAIESPALEACRDSPPNQPALAVSHPRQQEATTTPTQNWRPW